MITTQIGNYFEWSAGGMTKYYYAGAERIAMTDPAGTVSLLLGDHLGSTSVTARTSGALVGTMRYDPWGGQRYSGGATPTKYHFTGQREESPIRLYWYNSRFYDSELGRFAQADTVVPDPYNPVDYDRYAYARYNPVRYNDPTGHYVADHPGGGTCDPHSDCNPLKRETQDLKGDEYRDWLVDSIEWLEWSDGDPGLKDALVQEVTPFVMKDAGLREQLANLIDPDLFFVLAFALMNGGDQNDDPDDFIPGLAKDQENGYSSRGNTGRTTPNNLEEQLAMEVALADPASDYKLPLTMTDPIWPASDGWVKMAQNINGVEIHYVYNTRTGKVDDFKFK